MIQNCWKCKDPFDTQNVDVSETIGLCASCYENFDRPAAPTDPSPPQEKPIPGEIPYNWANEPLSGNVTSTTTIDQGVLSVAIEIEPFLSVDNELETISQRIFQTLQVPKNYLNPKGSLASLQKAVEIVVKEIRDQFTDVSKVAEATKRSLRQALTAQLLLDMTPTNVPIAIIDIIDKVVEECIEQEFKHPASPPALTA
jgi:hypothetical protein